MMFTIIFPVLNERLRLESGVTRTVEYLRKIAFEDYEIIIVDNGSEDETPQIAEMLCQKYEKVRYERINVRGVGAAFRRGVELSHGDVVGYMDIDLSTNIKHLGEAIHLFETQPQIEYINGSRFARESDTKGRNGIAGSPPGTVDSVETVPADEVHGCHLRLYLCTQTDCAFPD